MPARITIRFCPPLSARQGDYVKLHGNGGSGAIDWTNPVSDKKHDLFPGGAGNFGAGLAPAGLEPAGQAWSVLTIGAGLAPAGLEPAGLGAVVIEAADEVDDCGLYRYGFKGFDPLGNEHVGTPGEVQVDVHVTPPRPLGLKKESYDSATDVLTLSVDDPSDRPLMDIPPSRIPGSGLGDLPFDQLGGGMDGIGGGGNSGITDGSGGTIGGGGGDGPPGRI